MSTATKHRSIKTPDTMKKVSHEAQNVALTLAGLYLGALVNKPLSSLVAKVFPSSSSAASAAPTAGLSGAIADYASPTALFLLGIGLPMFFDFGDYSNFATPVFTGMSIYGGSAIIKTAMGKNLLAGQMGAVVDNVREINAARIISIPEVNPPIQASV